MHALKSRVEVNLPEPLDDDTAEQIWPSNHRPEPRIINEEDAEVVAPTTRAHENQLHI